MGDLKDEVERRARHPGRRAHARTGGARHILQKGGKRGGGNEGLAGARQAAEGMGRGLARDLK
jgi:hypothetical protein